MDTAYFQAQPFYWVICSTSLPSIVSSGLSGARLWRGVMPPKKQDVYLPEVEDEVDLPEDLLNSLGGKLPTTSFCLVLGHLSGHNFRVQPPSEDGEASPLQDFDPCALILNQVKQSGDAPKSIVLLDKEELGGYCQEAYGLQDQPIWAGLKFRLEKERAARQRAKSNALRRKLIADFEEGAEGGDLATSPAQPEVDVLFLLDAPEAISELQAISDAGLSEVVDLWSSIYFAGKSMDESEPPVQVECATAEVPELFYQAISSAAMKTDLANCTVCTVAESHELAFAVPKSSAVSESPEATFESKPRVELRLLFVSLLWKARARLARSREIPP